MLSKPVEKEAGIEDIDECEEKELKLDKELTLSTSRYVEIEVGNAEVGTVLQNK
jgi:hypothetical protein